MIRTNSMNIILFLLVPFIFDVFTFPLCFYFETFKFMLGITLNSSWYSGTDIVKLYDMILRSFRKVKVWNNILRLVYILDLNSCWLHIVKTSTLNSEDYLCFSHISRKKKRRFTKKYNIKQTLSLVCAKKHTNRFYTWMTTVIWTEFLQQRTIWNWIGSNVADLR